MSDFHIPPIFDWQVEQNKKIAKEKRRRARKQARQQWWKDNLLAVLMLIIAVLTLLATIVDPGRKEFTLPKSPPGSTQGETTYPQADDSQTEGQQ